MPHIPGISGFEGNDQMQPHFEARMHTQARSTAMFDVGLRRHMLGIYRNMGIALIVSGLIAYAISATPALYQPIFGTPLKWVAMFTPLALPDQPALGENRLRISPFICGRTSETSNATVRPLSTVSCGTALVRATSKPTVRVCLPPFCAAASPWLHPPNATSRSNTARTGRNRETLKWHGASGGGRRIIGHGCSDKTASARRGNWPVRASGCRSDKVAAFQLALAETERFELSVPNYQYDGLANRWFQPLTHVSGSQQRSGPIAGAWGGGKGAALQIA